MKKTKKTLEIWKNNQKSIGIIMPSVLQSVAKSRNCEDILAQDQRQAHPQSAIQSVPWCHVDVL